VDEGRTLDEAVRWTRAADDEWEIAEASHGKVPAAPSIADLRGRVERAALLLSDVGNVYQLARICSPARPTPRSVSAAIATQRTSPPAPLRSSACWTVGSYG
jgi:hypothetical protein